MKHALEHVPHLLLVLRVRFRQHVFVPKPSGVRGGVGQAPARDPRARLRGVGLRRGEKFMIVFDASVIEQCKQTPNKTTRHANRELKMIQFAAHSVPPRPYQAVGGV